MKIEKISDNQIKCTLNKADLASRQIKLSELAYGTEKTKSLFRDMMQQASHELGFEAEDLPLMIEAIPVNSDCIILLITKVEDPEELDTRFSRFAPSPDDMEEIDGEASDTTSSATGLLDMVNLVKKELKDAISNSEDNFIPLPEVLAKKNTKKTPSDTPSAKNDKNKQVSDENKNCIKIFAFDDLDIIIDSACILTEIYNGTNTLYKSKENMKYYLVINKSAHTAEDFNRACNILSEYGSIEKSNEANEAYYNEHFVKIIPRNALQKLSSIRKEAVAKTN